MSETVVKITNLVKRYKELIALDNFSLEIKKGEVFGLLGPNGSGKTTTINCLLSLLSYDKGEILLFGEKMDPNRRDLKARIGIVSQNGDIDSDKAFCYDIAYKFINGTIAVIDQDKTPDSRATYGPLQYDYRDRIFQDETFINDEKITIGYYPDGDSGLAYVAVFDRSADIYEIMDLIISLEI